ncbi:MAG: hypothetical protein JWN45_2582 [Acidobacteriaceae bacterium]|nr:hypothetical protein [Acidobacteriaceae bacterium]
MPLVKAFVARSFDPKDEDRIRPLLSFLESPQSIGFIAETAQRAEVESVSIKVQRMIDDAQVFVGIFTTRHPIVEPPEGFRRRAAFIFSKTKVATWSAPAWVLQELGYAVKSNKQIILLIESGIETFGLQGDLEYIVFDPSNFTSTLTKLNQMISDIVAKASGTEVKITVSQIAPEQPVGNDLKVEETSSQSAQTEEKPSDSLIEIFIQMKNAIDGGLWDVEAQAYESGRSLINNGKAGTMTLIGWECLRERSRFTAGFASGLDNLLTLCDANPDSPEPLLATGLCYLHYKEYEKALGFFQRASDLAIGTEKVSYLLRTAECFVGLKKWERCEVALESALKYSNGSQRSDVLVKLYEVMKGAGRLQERFAIAEYLLHEHPQAPIRFALGLDYHAQHLEKLALYHFDTLVKNAPEEAGAIHNLALMCMDCALPISGVDRYRQAIALGETLASANLGQTFLEAGMELEARATLKHAMNLEPHDARVDSIFAQIESNRKLELSKYEEILSASHSARGIFVEMGEALLRPIVFPLEGTWEFPFGEAPVTREGNNLLVDIEITTEEMPQGLFGLAGQEKVKRTQRYRLAGQVHNSVWKFNLRVSGDSKNFTVLTALSGTPSDESGFVIFDKASTSAKYFLLDKNSPKGIKEIRKRFY